MPCKKKKYNARFPPGRIKKIMQKDEEVGKVAQAVPIIISRTLELFVESLLKKSAEITLSRNAKTLTPSHMKQCILSENRFDFLKDLVNNIPDASVQEDNENNALIESSPAHETLSDTLQLNMPVPSKAEPSSSARISEVAERYNRTPVIQYGSRSRRTSANLLRSESLPKNNYTAGTVSIARKEDKDEEEEDFDKSDENGESGDDAIQTNRNINNARPKLSSDNVPPLIPLSSNLCTSQSVHDNLLIDEDYDN